MATRSTSKSSSRGGGKSAAARKKNAAQQRAKRQMRAVVLFALGIFLMMLTIIQGASFWNWLHNAMFGLFGPGAALVAASLIYLAVLLTMDKPAKAQAWEVGFLVAFFCGALQIFLMKEPTQEHLLDQFIECIIQGMNVKSGGFLGALVGLPLLSLFGPLGAGITIVLLIFVFLMLITGTTLIGLARGAARPVKKLEETYAAQIERQEERRAQRAAAQPPQSAAPPKHRPIDIPLDGEERPPVAQQRQQPELEVIQGGKKAQPTLEVLEGGKGAVPEEPPMTFEEETHPKVEIDIPIDDEFEPVEDAGLSFGFEGEPVEFSTAPSAEESEALPGPSIDELVSRAAGGNFQFDVEPEQVPQGIPHSFHTNLNLPPELPDYDDEGNPLPVQHNWEGSGDVFEPEEVNLDILPEEPEEEILPPVPEDEEIPSTPQTPLTKEERGAPDQEIQQELQSQVEAPPPPEYVLPPIDLLEKPEPKDETNAVEEMKANAQRLVDTLASFGVQTRIVDISRGPTVTRYELQPSAGVKISKITSLADDIALNLATAGVRIEAPIPNKAAVGIEVPNKGSRSIVSIREVLESEEFQNAKSKITSALGRDIAGKVTIFDIHNMPHLLIAGSTGSGKSVCINTIIISLLYKAKPEELRLLMVDPKMVELSVYNGIPHLLVPVVTDPKKAAGALSWAVGEMEKRYKLFSDNAVRNLEGFNRLAQNTEGMETLPQIVIIIDELADLMMTAPKEIEDYICRLTQKARAAGMYLIIATQRPSVDVITGLIKANVPSRIAFAVSSQVDSRTILDTAGAEKLLGKGDMLFSPVGTNKPTRIQGCWVSDEEIERVLAFIKEGTVAAYDDQVVQEIDNHVVAGKGDSGSRGGDDGEEMEDDMLLPAIECVVEAGIASTSLLQRRLKLGYARAARIVDEMEARGIVGPFEGSKPRQVLISKERWIEMKMNQQNQGN